MFLFVGLGNPGSQYKDTRHNVGFMAIDYLIYRHNFSSPVVKFDSEFFTGKILDQKIIAIKPNTYMNLSGRAVSQVVKFYKISLDKIIVIYDDIDLKLGDIRVKIGGGSAGHNGVKDIDKHLGKNYKRVRIGVGRPTNNQEVSDYVLSKFKNDEKIIIDQQIDKIITDDFISTLL